MEKLNYTIKRIKKIIINYTHELYTRVIHYSDTNLLEFEDYLELIYIEFDTDYENI